MQGRAKQEGVKIIVEQRRRLKHWAQSCQPRMCKSIKKNKNQCAAVLCLSSALALRLAEHKERSRVVNRCMLTGRAKAYQKLFGVSRLRLRLFARDGKLQNTKTRS